MMEYDGNDRFRNWGPNEYENKIKTLEALIVTLKSDVITCKEQKVALVKRFAETAASEHRFGF